jgi:hypothetical protein
MSERSWPRPAAGVTGPRRDSAEWRALEDAFAALAGYRRLVIYDVARQERPRPLRGGSKFLRDSARWHRYLLNRRRFDTGYLTFIFALRRLDDDERLLAVDWGSAFANTFLLVEPLQPEVDLADAENRAGRSLLLEMRAAAKGGDREGLIGMLRGQYASWVYWPAAPATPTGFRRLDLPLADGSASLAERLQALLPDIYQQIDFQQALDWLLRTESELFRGRVVEHARSPFLTRLGLPLVYDASSITNALRRLVNEGRSSVRLPGEALTFQGPERPVPDDLPNELFERMVL